MNHSEGIKGLLIDLDGVLYVGAQVISGAIETINNIRQHNIPCRFITNTSTVSRQSLHHKLTSLGFQVQVEDIISAPQAALYYIQQYSDPVCYLLLADDVKQDFQSFRQSDKQADFVIIGDIANTWSYDILNTAFRLLNQGAKLIAIHKNRYWQTEQGLQMDIGGFITALEYVSNQQAIVIGKPSLDFFQVALEDIGLPAHQIAIIGDDIESDVGGGQAAGLQGVLVRTGKFRQQIVDHSLVNPDLIIDSIADLPGLLGIEKTV